MNKTYPYLNRIICGDCLAVMRDMPDASVDLIITSPPYNLRNTSGHGILDGSKRWKNPPLRHGYSHHDDCMPHEEYVQWQRECLMEMMRLLKDDGAIFYNHKWRVQKGLLQDRADIVDGFPVADVGELSVAQAIKRVIAISCTPDTMSSGSMPRLKK